METESVTVYIDPHQPDSHAIQLPLGHPLHPLRIVLGHLHRQGVYRKFLWQQPFIIPITTNQPHPHTKANQLLLRSDLYVHRHAVLLLLDQKQRTHRRRTQTILQTTQLPHHRVNGIPSRRLRTPNIHLLLPVRHSHRNRTSQKLLRNHTPLQGNLLLLNISQKPKILTVIVPTINQPRIKNQQNLFESIKTLPITT